MVTLPLLLIMLCLYTACKAERNHSGAATDASTLPTHSQRIYNSLQAQTCSEGDREACPPALFCVESHCRCGVYPYNIISCNGTASLVLRRYCVTYDNKTNLTLIGSCIREYNKNKISANYGESLFHVLPSNQYGLQHDMCQPTNRTGTLCGRCLPGHYPLAYSFNTTCIPCPHARWNWFRYIMAAYLPLTLFYFIILFFKINTTSSYFFVVVYYCQDLTMPLVLRSFISIINSKAAPSLTTAGKVMFSLYGMWNLDFFRLFYSDLCLRLDILPTLALDYAVAMYPLLLIGVTYLLIVLYDKNYRVVTIMWTPFRALFSLFRRNWDIKTSVIDAFATFFFLSNVKFLSVSFDLLTPIKVYQLYFDHFNHTFAPFMAGDMKYFGKEHLPYAILAFIMLCVFVLLPIITLTLYPFAIFQKFLNLFPVRWYILHTFMDSFQGCYKDGTQPGTRDCRWFASVFFTFRLCHFLLFTISDKDVVLVLVAVSMFLLTLLIVVFRPFKQSSRPQNVVSIMFLQFLTLVTINTMLLNAIEIMAPQFSSIFYVLEVALVLVPFLYSFALVSYWIFKQRRFGFGVWRKLRAWSSGYAMLSEPLPDRIENSSEYPRENLSNFISVKHS